MPCLYSAGLNWHDSNERLRVEFQVHWNAIRHYHLADP